ncbi:hypothetical protein TW95_gp1499 [Pandoravirus inopinatum]|uniref:Uncharacterized protein n=1 Tax=Pandoravirus inopinatum TaxID=1605721 RepID=A0A0B5IZC2_9VIRU|nr:hypothetical protein TW95_gp1499 [Pandoravirus inopinatum]AJF98233.1 hypothetical protein [Pandoravirus inopinatum]
MDLLSVFSFFDFSFGQVFTGPALVRMSLFLVEAGAVGVLPFCLGRECGLSGARCRRRSAPAPDQRTMRAAHALGLLNKKAARPAAASRLLSDGTQKTRTRTHKTTAPGSTTLVWGKKRKGGDIDGNRRKKRERGEESVCNDDDVDGCGCCCRMSDVPRRSGQMLAVCAERVACCPVGVGFERRRT